MKKVLSTLACAAMLATTASADFLRVEAGAGSWSQTTAGSLSYTASGATAADTSDESTNSQTYAWALVKHFVPVIPNLRVEYTTVGTTGTATGTFKGFTVAAGGETSLDMTQIDVIPYYNILDNTFWTTIDLGLSVKMIELTQGSGTSTYDYDAIPVPMGYVRARVQVPMTGFGAEADMKIISGGDNEISDTRIKVDYTLNITPLIQPGIEVGYRVQKVIIDDTKGTKVDYEFSGMYAGLMLRF